MKKYKISIRLSRKYIKDNYLMIPDNFILTKIVETDFDLNNQEIKIIINKELYTVKLDWERSYYILDDNYFVVYEKSPICIETDDLNKFKENIDYLMKHDWRLIHE